MKFSSIVALVLMGIVLVEANRHYNSGHGSSGYHSQVGHHRGHHSGANHHGARAYAGHGAALAHGAGHHGGARYNHAYGPYHSYAVRPAVYGGHGLYRYRGYARQPTGNGHHYRQTRGCSGYNCNSNSNHNQHYRHQQHHSAAGHSYGFRPVNAVLVQPAYRARGGHHAGRQAHGGY